MAPLDRRQFCRAFGAAAVLGVAGCLHDGSSADDGSGDGGLDHTPRHDWPMHGYDAANTGYHLETNGPDGSVSARWTLDADSRVTPAVVDGTVYGPGPSEVLGAVDATDGSYEWRYDTADGIDSSVAVVDGTVYASDRSGELYAVDAAEGEERWTKSVASGGGGMSPSVVDGTVYAGSYATSVVALDAVTGEERWQFDVPNGSTGGTALTGSDPAVADGTLYVGGPMGAVYALDASDGAERWTADLETDASVVGAPTVSNGLVYVGSPDWRVFALDAETGDVVWERERRGSTGMAVADGTLFVTDNSVLNALDADTGEFLWQGSEGGWEFTNPVVSGGIVYHGSAPDALFAYDAQTGELAWEFETEHGADVQPGTPVVVDGVLFYGHPTGFYALTSE